MSVNNSYPANRHRLISIPRIKTISNNVISFFKKHPLFRNFSLTHTGELHEVRPAVDPGYTVTIRGDKGEINNSVFIGYVTLVFREERVDFPIKYSNEYENKLAVTAYIPSVVSDVGQSFGFFLVRIAMVIAILSGASVITLDNDTRNPERAAKPRKGVYGLFQPNLRSESGNRQTIQGWSKHNLNVRAERARFLEPSDLGIIEQNLIRKVKGEVNKAEKENNQNSIWRGDAIDTLREFFRSHVADPREYIAMGGRRTRRTRRTRRMKQKRNSHKRRKSSTTRR